MFLFLSMDNTIACVKSSGMDLPWLTYFKFSQAWAYFFETAGRVSWRDIVRHLLPVQHLESHWRRSRACKRAWCQTKTETIDEKKNPPTMSPRFHLLVGGGAQRRSLKRRTRTTGTATTTNNAPPSGAIKNTNTKKKKYRETQKVQKPAQWRLSYPAPPFGSTKNWSSVIVTISQSHIHKILAKISHISNDLYLSSSGRENRRCVKSQWSVACCRLVVVVAGATSYRLSVAPPNTQLRLQRQSKLK